MQISIDNPQLQTVYFAILFLPIILLSARLGSKKRFFDFYKKRLKKLFVPMWGVAVCLIILDLLILKRSYPSATIIQSFLGFFPTAEIFKNLDSPLWYFSLIFFYYLVFPITFWRKFSYLCPALLLLLSFFLLRMPLPINITVLNLYKLHSISFPLGVLFALLVSDRNLNFLKLRSNKILRFANLRYISVLVFMALFAYTSVNSGIGLSKNLEQAISLITMFSVIFIFLVKGFEFKLFNLFGIYSYEIYLIHWPILSRYDLFYKFLPASIATLIYLGFFLILGNIIKRITSKII